MQLIRYFAIFAFLFLTAAYIFFAPVRLVKEGAKGLTLAAFGYSFGEKQFSGVVYDTHQDSQLARITFLLHGKRHGPELQWYANGQRFIERYYRQGLEVGTHKAWYEDGSVKFLKNFHAGLPHGEFYDWHPNGQLAQFVVFENGKEVAAKSWTAGGKPFYNYVWHGEQTIGLRGDTFCSPLKKRL